MSFREYAHGLKLALLGRKEYLAPPSELRPERAKLAQQLSKELWDQRMGAIERDVPFSLRLNEMGAEGVEKILDGLAVGDLKLANLGAVQLTNGMLADAPEWIEFTGE